MPERVILSIGTRKGLFVAEASKTPAQLRAARARSAPGVAVYTALIDTRGTPRIYASSCNAFFGMKVLRSTDLGKTFKETKSAPAFPKDDGRALANIWSLEAGEDKKELWCGVEPASLFRSGDGGDSWEMVPGISNHEHARKWQPGQRRALPAHDPARREARAPRHLDRRPLPERGRRQRRSGLEHRASAPASRPIPIPSSASACTRSPATRTRPAGSTCRTTAAGPNGTDPGGRVRASASCAATTTAAPGARSPRGCPPISASRSSVHPHDPDTLYVVPLDAGDAHLPGRRARGLAQRGRRRLVEAGSPAGCRRRRASSPFSATPWTSTS